MARRSLLAASLLVLAAAALAQVAVPPVARVIDLTGTLAPAERAALEQRLADFERAQGSQIAVLMLPSTQPEAIEQYGIRVAEQWRLGRQGVDDGVLLLIAKQDRRLRIEVGYGLEGAIPDAIAKRIVAEVITPHFRQDHYYAGIVAGVEQLMKVIQGEPLPEPAWAPEPGAGDRVQSLFGLGLFTLFIGSLLARLFGEFPAALLSSGGFGALAGMLGGSLALGLGGAMLMFVLALAVFASRDARRFHGGRGGRGGVIGSWGGGSRGGGFGGGGFRGGGGGFGGGGASGGW